MDKREALRLLLDEDFIRLGRMADEVRAQKHPDGVVTFVVDRNINYSNICTCQCSFCAFYRAPGHHEGYLLDRETIYGKIAELEGQGGTQVLMQGGLHPDLKIEWFEELFRGIKERFPGIQLHSLSPSEITHIAELSGLELEVAMERLRAAGLDSIPGGGAEVLVDSVRKEVSPKKIGWKKWARVMETAQKMGMVTTATMMFGQAETDEDIVEHLFRVREMQANTGGFTAFIPWTFQPSFTELGKTHGIKPVGAVRYLRVLALSRLILDNVPSIQASWVTQGDKTAQVALSFGANDMGSTMLEENVVAAAGVSFRIEKERIISLIRDAGFTPAQRSTNYRIIQKF